MILAVEKHRHKAEITIRPRNGPLVGLAQAGDMISAIGEALDHLQKQAVKYNTRWRSKKRHQRKKLETKKWDGKSAPSQSTPPWGSPKKPCCVVVVHKFPATRQIHRRPPGALR